MPRKFDWHSEDEEGWEVYPAPDTPASSSHLWRRQWLWVSLVTLLIFSVGLISFRQLVNYLDETELEASQDIVSSNELVLSAALAVDPEIAASLLSGRDPIWAAGQLDLIKAGLMFDRVPFGFQWQAQEMPVTEVTVSPGIDGADVTTHLRYSFASAPGISDTITLQHQLHYRLSSDRWLLSAPVGDYWGPRITEEGYYLRIGFPERDAIIGRQLAIDLEGLLGALCTLDNMNSCSLAFPFQIDLVADPSSIIRYGDPISRLSGDPSLELPTPSLFGLPADEKAYQALYRSYGERIGSAIVAEQSGWQCCQKVLFYQALLDQQLVRLGLIPSPLTADHYRQALSLGNAFDLAGTLWIDSSPTELSMGSDEEFLAYLLTEYIVSDWYDGSLIELQQKLLEDYTFSQYLEGSIQHMNLQAFEEGWLPFLNRRLASLEN